MARVFPPIETEVWAGGLWAETRLEKTSKVKAANNFMLFQSTVEIMKRFAAWILLVGILGFSVNRAFAHFKFVEPPSALSTENGGKGAPPCGEGMRAELPKDAEAVVKDGQSVSAPIDSNPKIPVLMDGVFVHTTAPRNMEWKVDVTLPNLTCDKCTLQVTEFMAQHGPNPGGGFCDHHCADLQITADPNLPPADKAWGQLGK
jgi:hypothetical protein